MVEFSAFFRLFAISAPVKVIFAYVLRNSDD